MELMNQNAVGGSIWCSKNNFFEIGGQNENMVSWGFEDNEFINRIQKLEKRFYLTPGFTYHLIILELRILQIKILILKIIEKNM